MNQELYIRLKTFLGDYTFNDESNFLTLHKDFKPHMNRRTFIKYMHDMGVYSKVARVNGAVKRQLFYDPKQDKYLLRLFDVFGTCPTCQGKGVVKVKVKPVI